MDLRVVLLCMVTAYGRVQGGAPYYRGSLGLDSRDARGQASNVKPGFVQPLDFSSFTQEFVNEEKDGHVVPFAHPKTSFGAESKKSGAFQIPSSEFASFPGQIFPNEQNVNKTGFVQPVQFVSSFEKGTNAKVYKTTIKPPEPVNKDQVPKATEEEDEDSYYNPSRVQGFKHSTKPHKPKKPYTYGKSSYPAPTRKPKPSPYYYPPLGAKQKDVEMILPKDKVLFLPMVNGRPKPYDGYRAAPEAEAYETFENEEATLREKRLNEGEIIYGKPKIALSELYHRQQRSPAEYYGGIYPYYDYSDAKLSVSGDTDPTNQKKKKTYPKKTRQGARDKPYNPYKYPKEAPKRRNKDEDASGESSEEIEDDSDEEPEETKRDAPFYKYTYDDTIKIPPLEIKKYPYERDIRDSDSEGTKRDESYDYDNVDEYTAGYERYIKTLPSDLETYFGAPGLTDRYSVEATENLESNKNCKKIEPPHAKQEDASKQKETEEQAETQVCYICHDPKTGDNYEQCAYRSQPKSQKYFFGGTTSFKSNETAEPTTYRYKRSTHYYPPYSLEESESSESEQYKDEEDYYKKPKKKSKKYKKKGKKTPKRRFDYNPFFKLQEASSTKRGRRAKVEYPPRSYDGPKYTYEGPEETYEGPAQHYEGPKETYEGPAEPYEGPINEEYYDNVDERIEDDEEETKQESQTSAPPRYHDYSRQKPKKRQSYSRYKPSRYDDYHTPGYQSDYRFGPEHFVDEGEPEDTKKTEQVKPKTPEKRGPHKFPASESRSAAAATDKQEKEEPIGEVKVFKNGDVCQKKRKEGMICMVCKNEKTAATYEQCQYSTKPKEKYYAYGSQKSYTTKNPESQKKKEEEQEEEEDSDQFPEKSDIVEKKILITTQSKVFGYDPPAPTEGLAVAESNNSPRILPRDAYGDETDNIETLSEESNQNDTNSKDFRESIERIEPRDGIEGLEEYLYDAEDSEHKATEDEKQSYKTYDDYFRDLFPDFSKNSEPVPETEEKEESESETHLTFDPFSNVRKFHEENSRKEDSEEESEEEEEKDAEASRPEEFRLKDRKSRIPSDFFLPYNEETHKKDLEKALGEFQNKDWSNCKKIVKKKLTCYQCVDKNGVNNEECMYVEASQPILKHLAYHEKKELKPQNKTIEPTTELAQPEKTLKRFRKAKNSHEELIHVAEPPKDAEYVENTTTQKGDFEGVEKVEQETAPQTETTETSTEQTPTTKPKPKKHKRHPKKRNKTIRNETTTERFEKVRKRKFPLKKFTETPEEQTSQADNKSEDGSFGLKNPFVSSTTTTSTTTTEAANLNQTEIDSNK